MPLASSASMASRIRGYASAISRSIQLCARAAGSRSRSDTCGLPPYEPAPPPRIRRAAERPRRSQAENRPRHHRSHQTRPGPRARPGLGLSNELPKSHNRLVLRVEVGDKVAVLDVHDRERHQGSFDRISALSSVNISRSWGGPRACGVLASFASRRSLSRSHPEAAPRGRLVLGVAGSGPATPQLAHASRTPKCRCREASPRRACGGFPCRDSRGNQGRTASQAYRCDRPSARQRAQPRRRSTGVRELVLAAGERRRPIGSPTVLPLRSADDLSFTCEAELFVEQAPGGTQRARPAAAVLRSRRILDEQFSSGADGRLPLPAREVIEPRPK